MGNAEIRHNYLNEDNCYKELDISRHVNYKQYCRVYLKHQWWENREHGRGFLFPVFPYMIKELQHVEGKPSEGCLLEIPQIPGDSIALHESLNASFNTIRGIPTRLPFHMPHLVYINLSHNQLVELPDTVGLLLHLKTLLLNHNRIQSLPKFFFHLVNLEKLDLSHNQMRNLSDDLKNLEALCKLNVSSNKLKFLPVGIGGLKNLKVILCDDNKLQDPPECVYEKGSEEVISYLRKTYKLSRNHSEQLPASSYNVFPRVRGNNFNTSVLNPHSAQVEYIQSQTHTTNLPSRIKTPLLPPTGATSLEADILKDKIIGLLYGAAIGDAVGLASCCMSVDECLFHYNKDHITYTDIIQDELRVRWKHGDWTSNFDKMVLILDSMISWGGVLDELDYAKRLRQWSQSGFHELGDTSGIVLSETIKQVVEHVDFLQRPHTAAAKLLEKTDIHIFSIENGCVRCDDDNKSVSSDNSNFSDMVAQAPVLPSSHPCISSRTYGTDNGAVVQCAILGIPYFFMPCEVETNTVRICKTTHSHPLCIASCVTVTNLIAQILQGRHDLDSSKSVDELIHKATAVAMEHIHDLKLLEEFTKYTSVTTLSGINMREQYNMSYTLKALAAGLVGIRSQQSFKSYMMDLLFEGGDSNSNCCVAGALLGCKYGFSCLPQDWIKGLKGRQKRWLDAKINQLLDMIGLP